MANQVVKVGMFLNIRGDTFEIERIQRTEYTYKATASSQHAKDQNKRHCISHICTKFECDDFEEGDIITERQELIWMTNINRTRPLVVHNYHTFKREEQPDERD